MKLAIFDLTLQSGPKFERIPTVAQNIIDWISPALPEAKLVPIPVAYGAPIPAVEKFDGFILSGSELTVQSDVRWIVELRGFLDQVRATQKPVFGICFGHQLMADTYGGRTQDLGDDLQIGLVDFEIKGQNASALIWHRDQVTEVPPKAKVFSSSDHCPIAGLEYEFPAMSVQFHPENTVEHFRQYFALGPRLVEPALAKEAEMSFESGAVEPDLFAEQTAAFFRKHVAEKDQKSTG